MSDPSEPSSPPPPPAAQVREPEPVLTLIQNIRDRRIDPSVLDSEDRRRCVEVLRGEGYSVAEIGRILKKSERTIQRDLAQIRTDNALRVRPGFAEEMAGEMVRQAEVSVARLRRIAREQAASAMERLMAESAAWRVHSDMIIRLQSLGHLPRVPTGVVARIDASASAQPIESYEQMQRRLEALERVDAELGLSDARRQARRRLLREAVQRGRLSAEIDGLSGAAPEDN